MVHSTATTSTVRVVVLMPPPVEPGQAPMNIKSTERDLGELQLLGDVHRGEPGGAGVG